MKNVVKCYKDFFGYFNALKTHCERVVHKKNLFVLCGIRNCFDMLSSRPSFVQRNQIKLTTFTNAYVSARGDSNMYTN